MKVWKDFQDIMRGPYFILEDKKVVSCGWWRHMRWLQSNPDTRVALDTVGEYEISTVFSPNPYTCKWFETLVTHPADGEGYRYYKMWEEAERGHRVFVRYCRLKMRQDGSTSGSDSSRSQA